MMTHSRVSARSLIAPVLALLLAACAQGGGGASGVALGERASFNGLSFRPPAAWTAEPPAGTMRLAQYRITPAPGDSEAGECVLFHFPGTGGSVEANLQRWYGQFEQPDGTSSADRARVEKFTAGGLSVTQVSVSGTYNASSMAAAPGAATGPRPGYTMVAGVVETAQGPWFLKCVGPAATMTAAAPSVRAALETVGP